MEIKRLEKEDLPLSLSLYPQGWGDINPAFIYYLEKDFCHPYKVIQDQEICGIGAYMEFEKSAWIGHIIVHPSYRRKGIGFQLTNFLVDILKGKQFETTLLLATELGRPVYSKIGFKKVSEYVFFNREGKPPINKISDKIIKYQPHLESHIFELDKLITGETRKIILQKNISNSFVYFNNNKVEGYYIPGLGEGPIYAINKQAGIELMKLKYTNISKAVLPEENKTGIDFLYKLGFKKSNDQGTRMSLGKMINWKPENIYNRIGGNFG